MIDAMYCEHANEVPAQCRCTAGCYCRVQGSCVRRSQYGESYFNQGNYGNYLERADRYDNMAQEIVRLLTSVRLLNPQYDYILDYGCGPGLFLRGLSKAGCRFLHGLDVSEWALLRAIEECRTINAVGYCAIGHPSDRYLEKWRNMRLMFALDVFEHMDPIDVRFVLTRWRPEHLIVRIPVCREDGGRFVLNTSEADPTHHVRWTKERWLAFLEECGYAVLFRFGLFTIYDSEGVLAALLKRTMRGADDHGEVDHSDGTAGDSESPR